MVESNLDLTLELTSAISCTKKINKTYKSFAKTRPLAKLSN